MQKRHDVGQERLKAGAPDAQDKLAWGELHEDAGQYAQAIQEYRDVLSGSPGGEDAVRALSGLGSCLERTGKKEQAFQVLEEAYAQAQSLGHKVHMGHIQVKLGKLHLLEGRLNEAIRRSEQALAVAEGDSEVAGVAYNLLGYAHNEQGDQDTSEQYFRKAMTTFKEAGDLKRLALAYNNLGQVFNQRCQWEKALEYLQVATSLQSIEGHYPKRRSGLQNLGLVQMKTARLTDARESFVAAQDLSQTVGDTLGAIRALLGQAGIDILERDYTAAQGRLEHILELNPDSDYPRETTLTYRSLGQLHVAQGEWRRAQRCYEVAWQKAVSIAAEGDLVQELLRLRSDLALKQGHLDQAKQLAQRALSVSEKAGDRMETALALVSAGAAEVKAGHTEGFSLIHKGQTALRHLKLPVAHAESLLTEARLRLESGIDRAQGLKAVREARSVVEKLHLAGLLADVLLTGASLACNVADADEAIENLESAKPVLARLADPELQRTFQAVQTRLESLLVESSVSHLGVYQTAGRLEELVEAPGPATAKLGEMLELVTNALEADGAALVFPDEAYMDASHKMGSASLGNLRSILLNLAPERPQLVLDTATARDGWQTFLGTRGSASFITVPMMSLGVTGYLFIDRLAKAGRSPFGPSHLNLILALVPQLSSVLRRLVKETGDRDFDPMQNAYLADVVTQSPDMVQILKLVERVSKTDLTVLLKGETGTGKTLIARSLHLSSPRSHGPFVTVDCAALPENLLESELFGHTKGSFTGANFDKKGLFEEADGGTVFLDEIGKAGLSVQRRLLHLLDRGEVRPVGAVAYKKLSVRVICATSKESLLDEAGSFLKDLFYRLNDIIVTVPPLRDRPEDIPLLSEYFLAACNQQVGGEAERFSRAARQALLRYPWPGNVRELEKAVRRAAVLADEGIIPVELLPPEVAQYTPRSSEEAPVMGNLKGAIEATERKLILKALDRNKWNKTRAAEELGLSRKGLKNKIARYHLGDSQPA